MHHAYRPVRRGLAPAAIVAIVLGAVVSIPLTIFLVAFEVGLIHGLVGS